MDNALTFREKFDALFTQDEIDFFLKFDEYEKRMKVLKDAKTKALKSLMDELGIEEFENDVFKIKNVAETTKKTIDTERLKSEGLYDLYTKETPVKGYVRMTVKYED